MCIHESEHSSTAVGNVIDDIANNYNSSGVGVLEGFFTGSGLVFTTFFCQVSNIILTSKLTFSQLQTSLVCRTVVGHS